MSGWCSRTMRCSRSMTVRQNLAFGLAIRRTPKTEIARACWRGVAELLGMADRLDARAKDLGGSELQRVAIGRTLVTKPTILLLDEPLSNLEAAARLAMRRELRRLQSEIGLTIVYVTHDQTEALSLADRIAVMSAGKIRQVEKTSVIGDRPDHIFVAGFLGSPPMNLLRGRLVAHARRCGLREGRAVFRSMRRRCRTRQGRGRRSSWESAPSTWHWSRPKARAFAGRSFLVEPRGPETVLTVETGGVDLEILAPSSRRAGGRNGRPIGRPREPPAVQRRNRPRASRRRRGGMMP